MQTRRVLAASVVAAAAAGLWAWGCGGGASTGQAGGGQTETPPAATTAATDTAAMAGGAGNLAEGEKIYKEKCTLCHGPEGRGDGPGAAALNPKPRNHHDQSYMHSQTDDQLFAVIKGGKGQMPAWGTQLTDQQIRDVLTYVRRIGETP